VVVAAWSGESIGKAFGCSGVGKLVTVRAVVVVALVLALRKGQTDLPSPLFSVRATVAMASLSQTQTDPHQPSEHPEPLQTANSP